MKTIIGINGKIGAGKGTLTHMLMYLAEVNNLTSEEFLYAYKLKKIVAELANVPFELTLTQEGKNEYIEMFDMTLGVMLQKIGTDVLRQYFYDDIWIKSVNDQIKKSDVSIAIISDLRFPNEVKNINEQNGFTIKIIRSNNNINLNSKRDVKHSSEIALDDIELDFTIINDGSKSDLYTKAIEVFIAISGIDEPIISIPDDIDIDTFFNGVAKVV